MAMDSRGRDLFSIQLEVTEKLLQAEERKLKVLKAEIEASKHSDVASTKEKARELDTQENNYLRIKVQYQRLFQELTDVATVSLKQKKPRIKASRSLPAIGLKQTSKPRPSVFESLVPRSISSSNTSLIEREREESVDSAAAGKILAKRQLSEDLSYKDGALVAGPLEALIQLLIPTDSYYPERSFTFAFILCSRLFLRPHQLMAQVAREFHYHLRSPETTKHNLQGVVGSKIVQLLSEWTETFPYDFRDERMMRYLKDVTQTCAKLSPDLRRSVGQLQSVLVKKLSILDKYEHVLAQVNAVAMERLIDPKTQVNILGVCEDPLVLAQQLTHIELERLNNIGPEEFIQTFVKSSIEDAEPLYRDMKKTNNIEAYVEWFNRLSYMVATEICVLDKRRNRVKVIEYFLDAAEHCHRLHNFNSCMAITAGVFMSPITRLRKTKGKLNSAKLERVEGHMDPLNNFSLYRKALEAAMGEASQSKDESCVVPFFSLLVKDIYFLHEGVSNKLPNSHIRFGKCMALARLVSQILSWKDTVLPYPRVHSVLNYLMTIPVHTDDELQLASYEIEAPENDWEKRKYQELRLLLGSFGHRIRRVSTPASPASPTASNFFPIKEMDEN